MGVQLQIPPTHQIAARNYLVVRTVRYERDANGNTSHRTSYDAINRLLYMATANDSKSQLPDQVLGSSEFVRIHHIQHSLLPVQCVFILNFILAGVLFI